MMKTAAAILLLAALLWLCMMPAVEGEDYPLDKDGFCPTLIYTCKVQPPLLPCSKDSDCDGTLKCCRRLCGFRCAEPNKVSPLIA
ncbi:waprin-Phi2-like [Lissotriton helveticus]